MKAQLDVASDRSASGFRITMDHLYHGKYKATSTLSYDTISAI